MPTAKRPIGRPRKGAGGVAVRALPVVSVRFELAVLARLRALAVLRGVSPSEVIAAALNDAFDKVAADDVRTLGTLARREIERLRVKFPEAE